jgi:hypothetical protein
MAKKQVLAIIRLVALSAMTTISLFLNMSSGITGGVKAAACPAIILIPGGCVPILCEGLCGFRGCSSGRCGDTVNCNCIP